MTEEIIKRKQEFLDKMSKIDVKPYLFTKNGMSYLPWSRCEELLKLNAPDSMLTEITFPTEKIITALVGETKDSKQYATHVTTVQMPYFTDGKTALVKVRLEIPSVEIVCETTLPIMDFKNQSIPIEKITMNDVNKSLKRCMVKCVAEERFSVSDFGTKRRQVRAQLSRMSRMLKRLTRLLKPLRQRLTRVTIEIN